jgi:membrane protease YdiL (CAAX protease family)
MMLRLWSVIKRHPLITFFVLTYALSWILESPLVFLRDSVTDTQGLVLILLASNVPSVLAIVLTAVVLGRGSLRKLLARLVIWRVNPLWYLVVVVPAVLAGGMVAFNALLGGPAISVDATLLSAAILLAFMIFPGSALGEEIGWRGYALPRLQTRMSALSASLILGVIWGFYTYRCTLQDRPSDLPASSPHSSLGSSHLASSSPGCTTAPGGAFC